MFQYSFQTIFALILLATTNTVLAQEIVELKELGENKGGSIEVSVPAEVKFNKNDRICFKSDKGKQVGCGKVFKTSDESVFVRVTAKTFAKMKDTYTAVIDPADIAAQDAAKPLTVKNILRLNYSPVLISPTVHSTVTYLAPQRVDSSTPSDNQYWSKDKTNSMNLVSMGFEWGRYLGPKSAWFLGLRYQKVAETTTLMDYVANVSTSYVTVKQSFSGLALSGDYAFYLNDTASKVNFFVATGLDLEQTAMNLTATSTDESVNITRVIASLNSKMITTSLRLRPAVDVNIFTWLGFHTGMTLMLPLVKFSASAAASVDDPHSLNKSIAEEDLIAAADHKPNRFGLLFDMGLTSRF